MGSVLHYVRQTAWLATGVRLDGPVYDSLVQFRVGIIDSRRDRRLSLPQPAVFALRFRICVLGKLFRLVAGGLEGGCAERDGAIFRLRRSVEALWERWRSGQRQPKLSLWISDFLCARIS